MTRKLSSWILAITLLVPLLAGCTGQSTLTATATSTPSTSDATSPVVSTTGEVVPAQWTTLSFAQPGEVIELAVKDGDTVKAGDVLARLNDADLKASLAQKQASIQSAEASLALVTAAPRADEVKAAQQAVAAAKAHTAAAVADRDRLYSGITQADIIQAENQVYQSQVLRDKLQENMDKIIHIGGPALSAGEALGNQLTYAELELVAAQSYLNDLRDGPTPDQLRIADAQVWLASAQAKAAQARLDLLMAGPQPEDVAIAQAKIDQAKADAAAVSAQLAQTQIVAPFDGTVTKVYIDAHQFVGPGQPIVQLADLSGLRVETTDLNEIDVVRVSPGDTAKVRFDALPGMEASGSVTRIAPKSTEGAGVNYTVVIQLDQIPAAVRWGMTAPLDIEVRQAK